MTLIFIIAALTGVALAQIRCPEIACAAIACAKDEVSSCQTAAVNPTTGCTGCPTCTCKSCPIPPCARMVCDDGSEPMTSPARIGSDGCPSGCPIQTCPTSKPVCSPPPCVAPRLCASGQESYVVTKAPVDSATGCITGCAEYGCRAINACSTVGQPACQRMICLDGQTATQTAPAPVDANGCITGCPTFKCVSTVCQALACPELAIKCSAGLTSVRIEAKDATTGCPTCGELKCCAAAVCPQYLAACKEGESLVTTQTTGADGCPGCPTFKCVAKTPVCKALDCPVRAVLCAIGTTPVTTKAEVDANGCATTCPVTKCVVVSPCPDLACPALAIKCSAGLTSVRVEGKDATTGCPTCGELKCCAAAICPQYLPACKEGESLVTTQTTRDDGCPGCPSFKCVAKTPTCDCRSESEKVCVLKGGRWETAVDDMPPRVDPSTGTGAGGGAVLPKGKRQIVLPPIAVCDCAAPQPGRCVFDAECVCNPNERACLAKGWNWIVTGDLKPQSVPMAETSPAKPVKRDVAPTCACLVAERPGVCVPRCSCATTTGAADQAETAETCALRGGDYVWQPQFDGFDAGAKAGDVASTMVGVALPAVLDTCRCVQPGKCVKKPTQICKCPDVVCDTGFLTAARTSAGATGDVCNCGAGKCLPIPPPVFCTASAKCLFTRDNCQGVFKPSDATTDLAVFAGACGCGVCTTKVVFDVKATGDIATIKKALDGKLTNAVVTRVELVNGKTQIEVDVNAAVDGDRSSTMAVISELVSSGVVMEAKVAESMIVETDVASAAAATSSLAVATLALIAAALLF